MDWSFLARYGFRYTLLYGGGVATAAYLLPPTLRGYGILAVVALGALLVGKAAVGGGDTAMSSGEPGGAGLGLSVTGTNYYPSREGDPSGAAEVFFAVGLVVFGLVALALIY